MFLHHGWSPSLKFQNINGLIVFPDLLCHCALMRTLHMANELMWPSASWEKLGTLTSPITVDLTTHILIKVQNPTILPPPYLRRRTSQECRHRRKNVKNIAVMEGERRNENVFNMARELFMNVFIFWAVGMEVSIYCLSNYSEGVGSVRPPWTIDPLVIKLHKPCCWIECSVI